MANPSYHQTIRPSVFLSVYLDLIYLPRVNIFIIIIRIMISLSLIMQQTQEVAHTNCLSHEVSIIFAKIFLPNVLLMCGMDCRHLSALHALSALRRSIPKVDFSQFMKCTWWFNFTFYSFFFLLFQVNFLIKHFKVILFLGCCIFMNE